MSKYNEKITVQLPITPCFCREFGLVMQIIRNRYNLSISDMAKMLHIKKETLKAYEAGAPIPFGHIIAIYAGLGMQEVRPCH